MCVETLHIGCKINLWLRVTGRLSSGCHTLDSFFLPLDEPHDTMTLSPGSRPGLTLASSLPELNGGRTSVHKACEAFAAATGFAPSLDVFLDKGIPLGAGLGGGSADAAALLLSLNRRAVAAGGAGLAPDALSALAAGIGADVPFFLHNAPARVGGVGEVITPAAHPVPGAYLLLLCPGVHVSTAWAFQALDAAVSEGQTEQNTQSMHRPLTSFTVTDRTSLVHGVDWRNDLEDVVFGRFPKLAELREMLAAHGAFAARMSGSGSSLFGLFASREQAEAAKKAAPAIKSFLHEL